MRPTLSPLFRRTLPMAAAVCVVAACTPDAVLSTPDRVAPAASAAAAAPHASLASLAETGGILAQLRRVTARYHDLETAIAEGFVLLHECENRPDEGPVGTVYVHLGRLLDGMIDPDVPDALVYEPQRDGTLTLVGVEFAVPYSMWTAATPPTFMGATFQREDEFGVFALHAWVWRQNPAGMFAETNPRVSCGDA